VYKTDTSPSLTWPCSLRRRSKSVGRIKIKLCSPPPHQKKELIQIGPKNQGLQMSITSGSCLDVSRRLSDEIRSVRTCTSSGCPPKCFECRVARFFLVHDTKTGKNVPNEYKMYQTSTKCTKWS
jgi:hypothetical protein